MELQKDAEMLKCGGIIWGVRKLAMRRFGFGSANVSLQISDPTKDPRVSTTDLLNQAVIEYSDLRVNAELSTKKIRQGSVLSILMLSLHGSRLVFE